MYKHLFELYLTHSTASVTRPVCGARISTETHALENFLLLQWHHLHKWTTGARQASWFAYKKCMSVCIGEYMFHSYLTFWVGCDWLQLTADEHFSTHFTWKSPTTTTAAAAQTKENTHIHMKLRYKSVVDGEMNGNVNFLYAEIVSCLHLNWFVKQHLTRLSHKEKAMQISVCGYVCARPEKWLNNW